MSEAVVHPEGEAAPAWQSAHRSHVGNVRAINEDAVYSNNATALWAVADGMGGHEAGDFASKSIVDGLAQISLRQGLAAMVDVIEDQLLGVNEALHAHARQHCGGDTCGSTVVAMTAREGVGVVLWAGDSRAYRLRGSTLEQITRDHNPISDLLDLGAVTEEEALAADTNVVTRAVGGQGDLHLDVVVFDVRPGDVFLLCTDGLYREVDELDLVADLKKKPEKAADELLRKCLAGTAADNVSLVVVRPELG